LWGIAEATLFFIVPDVLLTLAALRFGWKKGLILSAIAALFAAIAGMGMWQWGHEDIATAKFAMLLVPAVDTDLLQRAARETGAGWPLHLVTGAMTGVPYKLYAVEAGARGIDLLSFAGISFAARFIRFSLTVLLAAAGSRMAQAVNHPRWIYPGWAATWIAVYVLYFTVRIAA
jgi:membrane protein YqaA with SNARE-associated domain